MTYYLSNLIAEALMRADTKRIVVISTALFAVIGSVFAFSKYQEHVANEYCREYALLAFSKHTSTKEYHSQTQSLEDKMRSSFENANNEEMAKFSGLLAPLNLDDDFVTKKFLECRAKQAAKN